MFIAVYTVNKFYYKLTIVVENTCIVNVLLYLTFL